VEEETKVVVKQVQLEHHPKEIMVVMVLAM
jgi:hypothetical protein